MGPIEYIVIGFPGNKFNGDVVPALQELVDNGTINILDLVFVHKDENGDVTILELEDEDYDTVAAFEGLTGEYGNLLSEEDLLALTDEMPDNTSAGLLVWENVWAERFAQAVRGSKGEVFLNGRIPNAVVEEALAVLATA